MYATLFTHARGTPTAGRRIIHLNLVGFQSNDRIDTIELDAVVYAPATLLSDAKNLTTTRIVLVKLTVPPTSFIRLYAPQPDPSDTARFTLVYETAEGRGEIEGKLQDDDTVTMRIVSGPCEAP